MSTQHQSRKDPHTLILEARQITGGIAALAVEVDGNFEQLTGEQLFFMLTALSDKLDDALEELELSDAA